MSFVNLKENIVYTPLQISKRLEEMDQQVYTKRNENLLSRTNIAVTRSKRPNIPEEEAATDQFGEFMASMEQEGIDARYDNNLLKQTISYEDSVTRLDRYILLDGQEGQEHDDATYDEETGEELTPEIPYIQHFDPLPEFVTVPVYDEEGTQTGTEDVRNPIVEKDEMERIAAQSIIDSASQEVLDLYEERKLFAVNN